MPRYHFPGMRRCENCKFCARAGAVMPRLECRRNPPQLTTVTLHGHTQGPLLETAPQFPAVDAAWWCGHHAFAPLRRLEEQKKSAAPAGYPAIFNAGREDVLAFLRKYAPNSDRMITFPRLVEEFTKTPAFPFADHLLVALKELELGEKITSTRRGEGEPTLYFATEKR